MDDGAKALRELAQRLLAEDRVNRGVLNLVPSENRLSPLGSLPLSTDFYNRYFFNASLAAREWQFRGAEGVGSIEIEWAIPALRRLARACHVNVRPISGMSAMALVLLALGGKPGDAVVTLDPAQGGHYATASMVRRFGRMPVTVGQRNGQLDEEDLRGALREQAPALVYVDLQNSLFEVDAGQVVRIVREESPETRVHIDVSHTLGLVLGGAHANPLDLGADTIGGSTHKTFPGPHKGIVVTRTEELAQTIYSAQFETISSHHFAETLSLGFSAIEFETFGPEYAAQVISNARTLAAELLDRDFDIATGPAAITDTHQVWIFGVADHWLIDFSDRLAEAGVRVNLVPLPGTGDRLAMRLGLAEITFEGGRAATMVRLAEIFDLARGNRISQATAARRELRAELGPPFFFSHEAVG